MVVCGCGKEALVEVHLGDHDYRSLNVCGECLIEELKRLPRGKHVSWVAYLYLPDESKRCGFDLPAVI
jgi:hypothetical protein